jgi:hypothetical protein
MGNKDVGGGKHRVNAGLWTGNMRAFSIYLCLEAAIAAPNQAGAGGTRKP